jgi:hypothetical protein
MIYRSLVTLQSAIADTKVQLEEIIESCDRLIEGNKLAHLVRIIKASICRTLIQLIAARNLPKARKSSQHG